VFCALFTLSGNTTLGEKCNILTVLIFPGNAKTHDG